MATSTGWQSSRSRFAFDPQIFGRSHPRSSMDLAVPLVPTIALIVLVVVCMILLLYISTQWEE